MSGTILDIEFVHINIFEELRVFIDGNVQGHSICHLKKHKPTKQAFGVKEN